MRIIKKDFIKNNTNIGLEFFGRLWEKSWTRIKNVVDVVKEPILILDKDLKVIAANHSFYKTFKVKVKDTENNFIYELGNGQWNVPSLRKLLEDILLKDTFFRGFQVAYDFPQIGKRIMILNARGIYREAEDSNQFPPIILLAIEDVSEIMGVAETFVRHTNRFGTKIAQKAIKLESQIKMLIKEINILKNNSDSYKKDL